MPKAVIGLRSATPEEINKCKREFDRRGLVWEHRTYCKKTGDKLAYNGVFITEGKEGAARAALDSVYKNYDK